MSHDRGRDTAPGPHQAPAPHPPTHPAGDPGLHPGPHPQLACSRPRSLAHAPGHAPGRRHGPAAAAVTFVLAATAGGTGRHVRALAAGLTERGVDVVVCAPAAAQQLLGLHRRGCAVRGRGDR